MIIQTSKEMIILNNIFIKIMISPNNNFIIYATKEAENGYLAGISLDGLAKFKIPSKIGAIREPVWSPFLY